MPLCRSSTLRGGCELVGLCRFANDAALRRLLLPHLLPQGISYAICYDATGESSGEQVREAVQVGGPDAQAAAYALLRDADRACGTSNPGAADRTYQHAVAAVTHAEDFEAAKQ